MFTIVSYPASHESSLPFICFPMLRSQSRIDPEPIRDSFGSGGQVAGFRSSPVKKTETKFDIKK